jgi:hemoglobin-like flavoprotein
MQYLVREQDDIRLLEESFRKISSKGDDFVSQVYDKLFDQLPETRRYFAHSDLFGMRSKLLLALTMVIENARRPDILRGLLTELGQRHKTKYRVSETYLVQMGDILLETMSDCLADEWTPEIKAVWREAMDNILSLMNPPAALSPN